MTTGKYSRFVPSIFKEAEDEASFMERYFKIFEHIFKGNNFDDMKEVDADSIDIISGLFHPRFTFLFDMEKKDFLPLLEEEHKKRFRRFFSVDMDDFLIFIAGWMGFFLKENWDIETKRKIIAKLIPLYRIRGTKKGLEEYLKIFTNNEVEILDEIKPFQVGVISQVGKNTIIGGLLPNYFIVNITLPESDSENESKRRIIEEMINSEKPLHIRYGLNFKYIKEDTHVN